MIKIEYFKPFHKKIYGNKLILLFAYECFTIRNKGISFEFVPLENTRIVINLESKGIENISDLFLFQNGDKFIKLPLYQLVMVSNLHNFLLPLTEAAITEKKANGAIIIEDEPIRISKKIKKEAKELIRVLEEDNITRLLEKSLMNSDKILFEQLMKLKK